MPGFYLLSIEDALREYRHCLNLPDWKPIWFPFWANGGGDYYAISCKNGESEDEAIIGYISGQPDQCIEYESLEKMLETIYKCYEQNVFYLTDDGYLEMNDNDHAKIAYWLNPSVSLWKDVQ